MTDVQRLLRAFVEDWECGLRPDVEAFLAAAPTHHQGEVMDVIEAFLRDAPVPCFNDERLKELESSQPVREAERALDGRSGAWPLLLPALRRQTRLTSADVARRLATELGVSSAHARVRQHLHNMEYGTADARGVSIRVLVALARVLGTTAAHLERAGRVATLGGPTSGRAPTRRALPDAPPFSEVPRGYRPPDTRHPPEWAALDRLFLGGDR